MTSNPISNRDRESADADKVNAALKLFGTGELDKVESLLLAVIANTPSDYSIFEEDDDAIAIKFWDQASFFHYIQWHKAQGTANKSIRWIGNAYPRAYFYLGFLRVKQEQFGQAIEFLDKGASLEPTNPNFSLEKAMALAHSGQKQEALALYDQVALTGIGPYVSPREVAMALRGRGSVLIEMGYLDYAEAAFKLSLRLEPENKIALNELLYIDQLRQGGSTTDSQIVSSTSTDYSKCGICGQKIQQGVIMLLNGIETPVCKSCAAERSK